MCVVCVCVYFCLCFLSSGLSNTFPGLGEPEETLQWSTDWIGSQEFNVSSRLEVFVHGSSSFLKKIKILMNFITAAAISQPLERCPVTARVLLVHIGKIMDSQQTRKSCWNQCKYVCWCTWNHSANLRFLLRLLCRWPWKESSHVLRSVFLDFYFICLRLSACINLQSWSGPQLDKCFQCAGFVFQWCWLVRWRVHGAGFRLRIRSRNAGMNLQRHCCNK